MSKLERLTDVIALKKIMVERGYNTISSLAKDAGVDRVALGKILNGDAQPSSSMMYRLVDTLEMEPATAGLIFFANSLRIA